jgi:hypothetical protein
MELETAAAVITYISKIEQESAELYRAWAERHAEIRDAFLSFAKENPKFEKTVKRAYYNAVSDALETGFSFKGLTGEIDTPARENDASAADVVKACIAMESTMHAFYLKASELSKSLLSDMSRAMARVAKTRKARLEKLESFQKELRS